MTGRKKCALLKEMRKKIAEENGIVYLSAECTYRGKCRGYCEKCDAEARYLESELIRLKESKGRRISSNHAYQSYLEMLHTTNNKNEAFPIDWNSIVPEYEKVIDEKLRSSPIEKLELPEKIIKALKEHRIVTVGDLAELSQEEIYYLGKQNIRRVVRTLKSYGIEMDEYWLMGVPMEDD